MYMRMILLGDINWQMLLQHIRKHVTHKLLRNPMVDIYNCHLSKRQLHIVILTVCRHIHIRTLGHRLAYQRRTTPPTQRDALYHTMSWLRITQLLYRQRRLELRKQINKRYSLGQIAYHTQTLLRILSMSRQRTVGQQTHLLSQHTTHTMKIIIYRSVRRIDGYAVLNSRQYTPFLGSITRQMLDALENQRMMRNN